MFSSAADSYRNPPPSILFGTCRSLFISPSDRIVSERCQEAQTPHASQKYEHTSGKIKKARLAPKNGGSALSRKKHISAEKACMSVGECRGAHIPIMFCRSFWGVQNHEW